MTALDYSDARGAPDLTTEDRRTHPEHAPGARKRRIDDSLFNRLRWPAFLVLWFAGGLAVLTWLIGG